MWPKPWKDGFGSYSFIKIGYFQSSSKFCASFVIGRISLYKIAHCLYFFGKACLKREACFKAANIVISCGKWRRL